MCERGRVCERGSVSANVWERVWESASVWEIECECLGE